MLPLLVAATIILILIIIFQIGKILEFLGILKGEKTAQESSNKLNGAFLMGFMVIGFIAIVWTIKSFSSSFLPPAASIHGAWIDEMFNITMVFTGIVFVITQVMLFYFPWRYNRQKNTKGFFYADNHKLEVIWTIIPAIVLTGLVIIGAIRWYDITGPAPDDALTVDITGKQFAWMPRYPGTDGQLGERNYKLIDAVNQIGIVVEDKTSHDDLMPSEIHLPVNIPVVFKIRARDVLHSFYLPHFRVKMDAVPGIPTQFWFIPTVTTEEMRERLGKPDFVYELACAELCGKGHSSMRMEVTIETEEEYNTWLAEQTPWYSMMMESKTDEAAPMEEKEPEVKEEEQNPATEHATKNKKVNKTISSL